MINTAHITVGGAIGLAISRVVPNPWIGIPLGFVVGVASHHLLDMIPHTDAGSFRNPSQGKNLVSKTEIPFALLDNIFGTLVVLYVFSMLHPSWIMLFGAAGGNFPDIFHHTPYWAKKTRALFEGRYFQLHHTYHRTARDNMILFGIITNLVAIGLAVWYLFR